MMNIKAQVLGKLISCEVDFVSLVWPSRGTFFFYRNLVQNVFRACIKSQLPSPAENVNTPLSISILRSYTHVLGTKVSLKRHRVWHRLWDWGNLLLMGI